MMMIVCVRLAASLQPGETSAVEVQDQERNTSAAWLRLNGARHAKEAPEIELSDG